MTKVINFFGQPGAGKSSLAAGLFYVMKKNGINCELVTEYAKIPSWRGELGILKNQVYVFAKQYDAQHRLVGKVDYIITDSPLLLSNYYGSYEGVEFSNLVSAKWITFENINFFITKTKPYSPIGRNQNEAEAETIGKDLEKMLIAKKIPFKYIFSDTPPEEVYELVKTHKAPSHRAYYIPELVSHGST